MGKIKVLLHSLWFPFTLTTYFKKALEVREDIELRTVGVYTGSYQPYNGGMQMPLKYCTPPDYPLPFSPSVGQIDYEYVKSQLGDWKPDLVLTGDAGVHWKSKPSDGIVAHIATDPHCISGDTLIATKNGVMYPEEFINSGGVSVCDKDGFSKSNGVIFRGSKNTMTLKFENGMELTCTDDHKIEVSPNKFVTAGGLVVGGTVLSAMGTYTPPEPRTSVDFSIGFIIGAFQGDGSFGSSDIIKFTVSKKEKQGFVESIKTHAKIGFDIDTVTEGKHYTSDNAMVLQIRRYGLWRFLKSLDLKGGHLPLIVRTGSMEMIGGYLSGLFSADGCSVNGLFQLTTKWDWLAKELQSLMWYVGIYTRLIRYKTGESSYKPGSKYTTMFVAAGQSTDLFNDLASDIQDKQKRYGTRKRGINKSNWQNLEIIEIVGKSSNSQKHLRVSEFVYDVINSDSQTFLANGVSVHNCLNYDLPRSYSDYFFNMQEVYSKHGDIYLPYAFDPEYHCDLRLEREYDVAMIGLKYPERDVIVGKLRAEGFKVLYETGLVLDEYREANNKAKIGINQSSLDDLNARAFEIPAMGQIELMNPVTDMYKSRHQYFSRARIFTNPDEVVRQVRWCIDNLEAATSEMKLMKNEMKDETYQNRVQFILQRVGLI